MPAEQDSLCAGFTLRRMPAAQDARCAGCPLRRMPAAQDARYRDFTVYRKWLKMAELTESFENFLEFSYMHFI